MRSCVRACLNFPAYITMCDMNIYIEFDDIWGNGFDASDCFKLYLKNAFFFLSCGILQAEMFVVLLLVDVVERA